MREHSTEEESLHFHIIFQMIKLEYTYIYVYSTNTCIYVHIYIHKGEEESVELNSRKYE